MQREAHKVNLDFVFENGIQQDSKEAGSFMQYKNVLK